MSDTYWGFTRPYAHRTVPEKWSRMNGYHYNTTTAFEDAAPKAIGVGALLGEPMQALGAKANQVLHADDNPVLERPQSRQFCMASYGLRQRNAWTDTLRDCNPRPYTAGPTFVNYPGTLRDARGRPLPRQIPGPHPRPATAMRQKPMSKRTQQTLAAILAMPQNQQKVAFK
ncbi:unnamed protein product [Amoebophrya sp. A120]|nr:unnamed protein product [Amoebophrya sp. A120]|eukprot:GSA120T00017663001.1